MTARSLQFVEPRTVEVESHTVPEPGRGAVLVESRASLVSAGTELLIWRGEAPRSLAADETIPALDGDLSFPLAYGYAVVGEVTATGPGVAERWEGEPVFVFHPHASHFVVPTAELVPVPDGIATEAASFVPILETAVNLVLDGAPRVGERAVVFGAGLVGLATVSILANHPLADLTVVEPLPARRELALELGADDAVAPDALDGDHDPDLSFELSGSPAALDQAVSIAGYDARIVVGSWYGEKPATLDLGGHFHRNRVSIVSSQVSSIDPALRGRWDTDRRLAVAWDRLESLPVDRFITHRVPIDEAARAYRLLDDEPDAALAVLLTYR